MSIFRREKLEWRDTDRVFRACCVSADFEDPLIEIEICYAGNCGSAYFDGHLLAAIEPWFHEDREVTFELSGSSDGIETDNAHLRFARQYAEIEVSLEIDDRSEKCYITNDVGADLIRLIQFSAGHCRDAFCFEQFESFLEEYSLPLRLAKDRGELLRWLIEDATTRLPASAWMRFVGRLAAMGRIDLSLEMIAVLKGAGLLDITSARLHMPYRRNEQPKDAKWEDLFRWSGLDITSINWERPSTPRPQKYEVYEGFNYVSCFEHAFEESLERIDFEHMDLVDVQARLGLLKENLDTHFRVVRYPEAEKGEIIPAIVRRQVLGVRRGDNHILFDHTPPVWHGEARSLLLFAHKVLYEDPLSQILDPILEAINSRSYRHGGQQILPATVHTTHLELLRKCLVNVKTLATLIRGGLVIPHCFLTARLPGASRNDSQFGRWRFREETSYALVETLAAYIGTAMAAGHLDSFGLPPSVIEAAKVRAEEEGGAENVPWRDGFFRDLGAIDRGEDGLGEWLDHLYHVASYLRYLEVNGMEYSPNFSHRHGYSLYAVLEALDWASTSEGDLKLSVDHYIGATDKVFVNRFDAFLRPRHDKLTDADFVNMRLNEELFAEWRGTMKSCLLEVEKHERFDGYDSSHVTQRFMKGQMEEWESKKRKAFKSEALFAGFSVADGVALGVISPLVLSENFSGPSIALGALYAACKGSLGLLGWRKKHGIMQRHYLSVI